MSRTVNWKQLILPAIACLILLYLYSSLGLAYYDSSVVKENNGYITNLPNATTWSILLPVYVIQDEVTVEENFAPIADGIKPTYQWEVEKVKGDPSTKEEPKKDSHSDTAVYIATETEKENGNTLEQESWENMLKRPDEWLPLRDEYFDSRRNRTHGLKFRGHHYLYVRPIMQKQGMGSFLNTYKESLFYAMHTERRVLLTRGRHLPHGYSPWDIINREVDPNDICPVTDSTPIVKANRTSLDICGMCNEIRERFMSTWIDTTLPVANPPKPEKGGYDCLLSDLTGRQETYNDCAHFFYYDFFVNYYFKKLGFERIFRRRFDIAVHYRYGDTKDSISDRTIPLESINEVITAFLRCNVPLNVYIFMEDHNKTHLASTLRFPYEIVDTHDDYRDLYTLASFNTIVQGFSSFSVLASHIYPNRNIITNRKRNKFINVCFDIAHLFLVDQVLQMNCETRVRTFFSS